MTQLPIPVHVGSQPPEWWADIEARQRQLGDEAGSWLRDKRRPTVASTNLDWNGLGFEPRWIGFATADCAVALQPSILYRQGADEFDRFRQGAERHREIALVISPIGNPEEQERGPFSQYDDSIVLGRTYTSINSQPIGKGARVRAASALGDADSQLALRMLSCNPAPAWRSLSLSGAMLELRTGTEHHPAQGALEPILETELGEPVVAVWVSPDNVERRYVVPAETPWPLLLKWLLEQALPEFVPGAMSRARYQLATDESLMTRRERDARAALTALDADYVARRGQLERQLQKAQGAASSVRESLLYGTGGQLVDAVQTVFESAGISVVDLDEKLGGTKNADLLCEYGGRSRLVEVKSASGSAPERAYQDLVRHLREWPTLPGSVPVEGGVLVISHELRTVPHERSPKPYSRPEFLDAQAELIITSLDLFAAWREEDAGAIRQLLFGPVTEQAPRRPVSEDNSASVGEQKVRKAERRRWWAIFALSRYLAGSNESAPD